jgi:hypothetical protein
LSDEIVVRGRGRSVGVDVPLASLIGGSLWVAHGFACGWSSLLLSSLCRSLGQRRLLGVVAVSSSPCSSACFRVGLPSSFFLTLSCDFVWFFLSGFPLKLTIGHRPTFSLILTVRHSTSFLAAVCLVASLPGGCSLLESCACLWRYCTPWLTAQLRLVLWDLQSSSYVSCPFLVIQHFLFSWSS